MSDPSLLVTCATASDPALAPPGRHAYYVLAPTPNLDARLDWSVIGPRYRDEVVETLERRGWVGFGSGIEVETVTTPADWRARGMERGAPFAAAHTFGQTGPLRLPNLVPGVENVVLAGIGHGPGCRRADGAGVRTPGRAADHGCRRRAPLAGHPHSSAVPAAAGAGVGSSSRSQSAKASSGSGRTSNAP